MLSSIRPYGLPAEPARTAPSGRPKPGPTEVPTETARTAPGANPAPTPTPLPTETARTAPAASFEPTPVDPGVDDAAGALFRLTYRADGRSADGPPAPTGALFDRKG